jgi:hypothetical protein
MNDDLRVHTDLNGIVWCGRNGNRIRYTGFSPEEFVTKNVFKTSPVVRAIGSAENSKLLLLMYEKHRKAPSLAKRDIWLASPAICPTARLRSDPVEILSRIGQADTTARISANWHRMKSVDFNAHLLRTSVDRDWDVHGITDKSRVIFQYHPAFVALSFFEYTHLNSAIRLLSLILDPRWYAHSERPNRLSKLMRFLGLTLRNFSGEEDDLEEHDFNYAALVTDSWFTSESVNYDSPRNFLWRIFRYHGGGQRGKLKASEAFIRFIVLHWLQDLSHSKSRLFDPALFFKTDEEIKAYNKHVSGVRS